MRVKSELWVKAYMRRCALDGASALLERRGDGDAGAIYIKIVPLDGTASLYGPAPSGLGTLDNERRWQLSLPQERLPEAEVDGYLAQQIAFDPDIWIVVVEDRQGRHFLDDWLVPPGI